MVRLLIVLAVVASCHGHALAQQANQTFDGPRSVVSFGSLLREGRTLPLLRIHLDPRFSFDLHGQITYDTITHELGESVLVGANAVWPNHRLRRNSQQ